jgi:hypothetical protein
LIQAQSSRDVGVDVDGGAEPEFAERFWQVEFRRLRDARRVIGERFRLNDGTGRAYPFVALKLAACDAAPASGREQ